MKRIQDSTACAVLQASSDGIITPSLLLSFSLYSPLVWAYIIKLPLLACHLLNFRPKSRELMMILLAKLGGCEGMLELRHNELSAFVWPGLSSLSGKQKLSRSLSMLREDQLMSGFRGIVYQAGARIQQGDGMAYFPSKYQVDVSYLSLCEAVSDATAAEDLFALSQRERDARYLQIVREALRETGAMKIQRPMKTKASKSKGEAMNDKEEEREDDATAYEQAYLVRDDARLPLSERVELEFDSAYASIKRVCDLFPEFEKPEEMKHVADKLLKYLVSNVNQALDDGYKRFAHVANVNRAEPYNVRDMAKYKKRKGLK